MFVCLAFGGTALLRFRVNGSFFDPRPGGDGGRLVSCGLVSSVQDQVREARCRCRQLYTAGPGLRVGLRAEQNQCNTPNSEETTTKGCPVKFEFQVHSGSFLAEVCPLQLSGRGYAEDLFIVP